MYSKRNLHVCLFFDGKEKVFPGGDASHGGQARGRRFFSSRRFLFSIRGCHIAAGKNARRKTAIFFNCGSTRAAFPEFRRKD